jgi:hypothetical protein
MGWVVENGEQLVADARPAGGRSRWIGCKSLVVDLVDVGGDLGQP